MAQIIQEQPVDVVCLGMGVTSGIVATELALAGYKVAGIEKGPYWDYANDFSETKYDEWGIGFMRKFDHPLPLNTYTLRVSNDQMALPQRRWTTVQSIAQGHGVGGMAQHYGGQMGRFGPWTYHMKSATDSRYGPGFLEQVEPNHDVEDWPLQYEDYIPYYKKMEDTFGLTGPGQDPLVPNSSYPLPPHPTTALANLFHDACEALGYHPYQTPTSLASAPYVNHYGISVNACVYEGWCGAGCNYVCETGAKANAAYRLFPAAVKSGNFTMSLNSYVFRIDLDPVTGEGAAVRYYDAQGDIHVQPAKVIYNGLWGLNIVRCFLLSGLGHPYNNVAFTGSMGRGASHVAPAGNASVTATFNIGRNAYAAGNAQGGGVDIFDLADDNFDHTGLNFIGGNLVRAGTYAGGGPSNFTGIAGAASANSMGGKYKASIKDFYLQQTTTNTWSLYAPPLPNKVWNVDLDPHYNDSYGDPLVRWTNDWTANSYNGGVYLTGAVVSIAQKMGGTNVSVNPGVGPGVIHNDNWPAHIRGGCRIGSDPNTSALNKYHQMWGIQNIFASGEITDTTGDNTTTGGTHPAGTASYVCAEGIQKYLESPGPLV